MSSTKSIIDVFSKLKILDTGSISGLEGFCSSGKSSLALKISDELPVNVYHVDDFARKYDQPPNYTDCLDLSGLQRTLEERDHTRLTVIEGICLRDVLSLIGLSASIYIYVKRIGKNGLWYDGFHLEEYEAEHAIPGDLNEPHRSDLEYHTRVRPHEHADLIYERIECEQ